MDKEKIKKIIDVYNKVEKGIDAEAQEDQSERAYGGIIRAKKGDLVEHMAEELINIAWSDLGGDQNRISFMHKKIRIPIKENYVSKIRNEEIKRYIKSNIEDYCYKISVDRQVCIDNEFFMGIECKNYTENAMMKRIMIDFYFLKILYPNLYCFLLQLESQLGGDYSDLSKEVQLGSKSTHTIMSYFDNVDLKIITLLSGDRKVDQPIHKEDFFKELEEDSLEKAVKNFELILKEKL